MKLINYERQIAQIARDNRQHRTVQSRRRRNLRGRWIRQSKKIGEAVRRLRQRAGVGQGDLARTMGISQALLSSLEAGRRLWTLDYYQSAAASIKALCTSSQN